MEEIGIVKNNNNKNNNKKDMDRKFLRISLCDCHTGRYITSTTKEEVNYFYDIIMKNGILTGDFTTDPVKGDAINTLGELKNYVENDGEDEYNNNDVK
jgi:hypothetical protein